MLKEWRAKVKGRKSKSMSHYKVERENALNRKSVENRIFDGVMYFENNPLGNAAFRVYCKLLTEEKIEYCGCLFNAGTMDRMTEQTTKKALQYLVREGYIDIENDVITII